MNAITPAVHHNVPLWLHTSCIRCPSCMELICYGRKNSNNTIDSRQSLPVWIELTVMQYGTVFCSLDYQSSKLYSKHWDTSSGIPVFHCVWLLWKINIWDNRLITLKCDKNKICGLSFWEVFIRSLMWSTLNLVKTIAFSQNWIFGKSTWSSINVLAVDCRRGSHLRILMAEEVLDNNRVTHRSYKYETELWLEPTLNSANCMEHSLLILLLLL